MTKEKWKVGDKLKIEHYCDCGCMEGKDEGDIAVITKLSPDNTIILEVVYSDGTSNNGVYFRNPTHMFKLINPYPSLKREDCM